MNNLNKIFICRVKVIISVMMTATISGFISCKSNNGRDEAQSDKPDTVNVHEIVGTAYYEPDTDYEPTDTITYPIHYSRPETIEVKELQGRKFSEFDTVFGKYVYDNYYHIYLNYWEKWENTPRTKALEFFYHGNMNLNSQDTVRILIAKCTGKWINGRSYHVRYAIKGSIDSVFFLRMQEVRTTLGYYDAGNKRYIYRVMHLRRSLPYHLLMQDRLDKLPRRFWKPLVPGEGDAFAVKLYIKDGFIRRAEVTHFYDVFVDKAFECPDDRRKDVPGYYIFPEGSPEREYLNKYEPGEKEYLDSVRNLNEGYFIE